MTNPEPKPPLHTLPEDMAIAIKQNPVTEEKWNSLTELAKNEWICWVTIVKKPETRLEHIERLIEDLNNGKRRPCCWPGCPHRRPNAAKWFNKKAK